MNVFITFNPSVLSFVAIPCVIAIFLCIIINYIRQQRVIALLVSDRHRSKFLLHYSLFNKRLYLVCMFLVCFFLLVAFMRPQWGKKENTIEHKGRDLVIALDISRSMLAEDYEPHRLAFAKQKIKQLAYRLMREDSSDRICLLIFSGAALIQCPFTHDIEAFTLFLNELGTDTLSAGTTALEEALIKALELFKRQPPAKDRLLMIVTDGEDFSKDLASIKEQVQKENVHTFIMGIGSQDGAPIPLFDEQGNKQGHQLDKQGAVVISTLNEPLLISLASYFNGHYIKASTGDDDLNALVKWVDQYEKSTIDTQKQEMYEDKYYYATACALGLLLLSWLL